MYGEKLICLFDISLASAANIRGGKPRQYSKPPCTERPPENPPKKDEN